MPQQMQIQSQKPKVEEIEQKVKVRLKQIVNNFESFKRIENSFVKTNLRLIKEIIDLRRIQNADYSFSNFLQEPEIINISDEIEKYVPYDELSVGAKKLYVEGKLDNVDAMALANMPNEFVRDTERQNKIVEKLVTKQVTAREILRATKSELYDMIDEKHNSMEEQERELLEGVYQIETLRKQILKYKSLFKNKKNKELLRKYYFKFKNTVNAILK